VALASLAAPSTAVLSLKGGTYRPMLLPHRMCRSSFIALFTTPDVTLAGLYAFSPRPAIHHSRHPIITYAGCILVSGSHRLFGTATLPLPHQVLPSVVCGHMKFFGWNPIAHSLHRKNDTTLRLLMKMNVDHKLAEIRRTTPADTPHPLSAFPLLANRS
jgi:hypothetical protein